MRKREFTFIVLSVLIGGTAFGRGFLTAQSFPETFQDLSFADRMAVLQEGYEIYEMQYDANGVCISGCAYVGVTIADDMRAMDNATNTMQELIEQTESETPIVTPGPGMGTSNSGAFAVGAPGWCKNGRTTKLPLRPPVDVSQYHVSSGFGPRTLNGRTFHPAVDIATPDRTPVYATADGTVIKSQIDSNGGGEYITIQHANGLVSQYLHLSKRFVNVGDKVSACQQIALSGNSGQSTGPHLDYRVRFDSALNSFVDLLCPKHAEKKQGGGNYSAIAAQSDIATPDHSMFYTGYRYISDSKDIMKQWRREHGYCLPNTKPGKNVNQLPDEIM